MAGLDTRHGDGPHSPDDEPRGCGWFESSHELQSGLSVTEHVTADALAAVAPLGWWLQWELEACQRTGLH